MKKPLRELFKGHFSDVFNRVYRGQSLGITELEKLDIITTRMATDWETSIEEVTLEKCKKLNEATKFGFAQVGEDVAEAAVDRQVLKDRMTILEENMVKVHDLMKRLVTEINKRPVAGAAPVDKPARGTPLPEPAGRYSSVPQPLSPVPAVEDSSDTE